MSIDVWIWGKLGWVVCEALGSNRETLWALERVIKMCFKGVECHSWGYCSRVKLAGSVCVNIQATVCRWSHEIYDMGKSPVHNTQHKLNKSLFIHLLHKIIHSRTKLLRYSSSSLSVFPLRVYWPKHQLTKCNFVPLLDQKNTFTSELLDLWITQVKNLTSS